MKLIQKSFQYGEHTVKLETGAIATQADGAVMVSMGDTMVLVTVCGKKEASKDLDFFPLTVIYQERYYCTGRLPGGFMKREGRPSINETLISRLIDRPIRPLFPDGFTNEVQIIATLMSLDPEISPDIPALIGAAAALAISGIPFNGPLAGARVGYSDGKYLLNPTAKQLKDSQLDLVVAGTANAVLMVESEAKELAEDIMLGAVMFGYREMQPVINAICEFAAEVNPNCWNWQPAIFPHQLLAEITSIAGQRFAEAFTIAEKQSRNNLLEKIRKDVLETYAKRAQEATAPATAKPVSLDDIPSASTIKNILFELEKKIVRDLVLTKKVRIDGRDCKTVRPINVQLGVLPRTHGSALFTRGETQALVVTTLGTESDAQIIDTPSSETTERFMLHYNFPPYSTGEVYQMGTPKRREIGHGNLAKRSLLAVIPDKAKFPYVLRVVSEITSSNGSSSMASVCGASLSLMDAGVPITSPVAGIAMGLIKEGEQFVVLTDILGDEDHLGDMDFKVAGTLNGITALQMDIKIQGITEEIMRIALNQAREGRIHIFKIMAEQIAKPRDHLSDFAPRIITIQISTDKIKDVIGKGGVVIRGIIEETGASIDINDQGLVSIASVNKEAGEAALARVKQITAEAEIGKTYAGKVVKILDFGAIVNFLPNKDGLVHISQIANERVKAVTDYLQEGQEVKVKVIEVDKMGKIRLSIKEADHASVD